MHPTCCCTPAVLRADLLEAAAQAVREALEQCALAPERLKRSLALGWSLATARACRAWAGAELADGAAGSAVAGIDVRRQLQITALTQMGGGAQTSCRAVWAYHAYIRLAAQGTSLVVCSECS
jgi:hypothetical protein